MEGDSNDKVFSYLARLNESLEGQAKIERQISEHYRDPRLNKSDPKARVFQAADRLLAGKRFDFLRVAWRKIQPTGSCYWFSNLDARHHRILKWMQSWDHSNAKAVFFVQTLDAGLKLTELAFLYAKTVPHGMIVVLLGGETLNEQKLRRLEAKP